LKRDRVSDIPRHLLTRMTRIVGRTPSEGAIVAVRATPKEPG
jgi:hypothetical protein